LIVGIDDYEKIKKNKKEAGGSFGEVILCSGKKVMGIILYSMIAALGRAFLKMYPRGKSQKKMISWLSEIFSLPQ